MSAYGRHITVLKQEAVEALAITHDATVVDATLGSLGHATHILNVLGEGGTLIGLDVDPEVITRAQPVLKKAGVRVILESANFRDLSTVLSRHRYGTVDGILADLGWRMEQFSGSGKGFSFQVDEPLSMTFGEPERYSFTARDIINDWAEEDIRNVLKGYGEERFAGRIAHAIVAARNERPIETTFELVEVIERAVPKRRSFGAIHPATRTFQALRIAVNDELYALSDMLEASVALLNNTGRLVVITFHSLEDRIVKHTFRAFERGGLGRVLTKKPIRPSPEEQKTNTRSRSAKLRIFERYENE